ncbi:MAG: uncharacterized protein JWP28_3736 [Phenylobacterium sp.]|uniref:hypothetical protein n=1 Tax=Phenylobacterium sp. TaxID=1871053 RepID=UPI0026025146|nr:hypothetical protein [Phenylobacterium sp.]MDB5499705.1 uncharacterized protein [Phenylobacterium sp.]
MIEKYGIEVAYALGSLDFARRYWEKEVVQNAFSSSEDADTTQRIRQTAAKGAFHNLRKLCILTDIVDLEPQIVRLERRLDWDSADGIARDFKALEDRLKDELRNEFFFHLDRRDVSLYGKPTQFGADVAAKFPTATEDIEGAGNCLALQQSTAAVFHLMRVMEIGVKTLGRRLKVKINVNTESWNDIMNHVDGAIRGLPAKTASNKRRKEELALISATLNVVRIAWRNPVMHPKKTYTREEAHAVFNASRTFMADLARLV